MALNCKLPYRILHLNTNKDEIMEKKIKLIITSLLSWASCVRENYFMKIDSVDDAGGGIVADMIIGESGQYVNSFFCKRHQFPGNPP